MRQERTVQASIFDVFAAHEIGHELKAMSQWLDEHRDLLGLGACPSSRWSSCGGSDSLLVDEQGISRVEDRRSPVAAGERARLCAAGAPVAIDRGAGPGGT